MDDLASRSCLPCHGGVPRLGAAKIQKYLSSLDGGWRVVAESLQLPAEWDPLHAIDTSLLP